MDKLTKAAAAYRQVCQDHAQAKLELEQAEQMCAKANERYQDLGHELLIAHGKLAEVARSAKAGE